MLTTRITIVREWPALNVGNNVAKYTVQIQHMIDNDCKWFQKLLCILFAILYMIEVQASYPLLSSLSLLWSSWDRRHCYKPLYLIRSDFGSSIAHMMFSSFVIYKLVHRYVNMGQSCMGLMNATDFWLCCRKVQVHMGQLVCFAVLVISVISEFARKVSRGDPSARPLFLRVGGTRSGETVEKQRGQREGHRA